MLSDCNTPNLFPTSPKQAHSKVNQEWLADAEALPADE